MNGNTDNFLYLNRDNRWLEFQWKGLEVCEEGTVRLAALPILKGDMPEGRMDISPLKGPAGIAVGPDGAIYYSDPSRHRILKIDPCDGALSPIPCMGGEGDQPTQFCKPRGLLFHPIRQTLFVADSGNHRIQLFDPHSLQLLGTWGGHGAGYGYFDTPWSLAGDSWGNIYVVDFGNARVQKFDMRGNVKPAFWDTVQKQKDKPCQPGDVAVSEDENTGKVFILDKSLQKVFMYDSHGHLLHSFSSEVLKNAMGFVTIGRRLYVGDNDKKCIHTFTEKGEYIGAALGYEGPVAALAVDVNGDLLVHTGSRLAPIRLSQKGGYRKRGILWGGPFETSSNRTEQWHRLKARFAPLQSDAHFRLFLYTSDKSENPQHPNEPELQFDENIWKSFAMDTPEFLFPGKSGEYIWIGAEFLGEGLTSPVLSQMRIDFDHETYIQYLPDIYKEDDRSRTYLVRLLSLFESLFHDVEKNIANLSAYFDPDAVPLDFLTWLAGWLAVEIDENWSEEKKRQVIANAFEMYAWRGTPKGLQKALQFFMGVDARIEEPILNASWWSLPEEGTPTSFEARNSILGFTTMLVPAEAQGAVVGTTAVLDRSHLITQDEYGMPLFEDVAHQFTVQVYRGQVRCREKLNEIHSLVKREKPAHTHYHLCIIEPRMRIGLQARVGIDTIVAGPLPPAPLGEADGLHKGILLGGESPGKVGIRSKVGQTTILG